MRTHFSIIICLLLLADTPALAQYCVPEYEESCSSGGSFINKFVLNSLSNTASGCNGNSENYIFYPASSFTTALELGGSYEFEMKSGSGSGSTQGFAFWIDFNDDEDFNDEHELIYSSPVAGNTLFTGTVIIPNETEYIGDHRLRVRSAQQSLLYPEDACKEFENGETEDYIVTILPAPACAGAPAEAEVLAFPSALCSAGGSTVLEITSLEAKSGFTFQWEESADSVNWLTISGATQDVYVSQTLDTSTWFRNKVTCENSGLFTYSNVVLVSIGSVSLTGVTGDTLCGGGTATVSADATGGQILWYKKAGGGLPLYITAPGADLQFVPDTTITLYASVASGNLAVEETGLADSSGSGSDAYKNGYLTFDVLHSCTIAGVNVYPSISGFVYVQLRDPFFNVLHADTFFIAEDQLGSAVFLDLELAVEPGADYQLFLQDESIPLWSTQSGVSYPYEIPGILKITESNLGFGYYFYFYNWVINYSQLCESPREPVTVYVEDAASVSVSVFPESGALCSNAQDSVTLTAGDGYINYLWSPTAGLSSDTGKVVRARPEQSTAYTLTASDSLCQTDTTIMVLIHSAPVVDATASSGSICGGTSVVLVASAAPLLNYLVDSIPFEPAAAAGMPVFLEDEDLSDGLPIGFEFSFFDEIYSTFYVSSNGYITFDSADVFSCCTGQLLPQVAPPNNLVAFAWEDLAPDLGGSISYATEGAAPDRRLIVRFDSVPHYSPGGGVDPVTAQIILYETSNLIEMHTASMPGNPGGNWFFHTQGIENGAGTIGSAVPGRNASNQWTALSDAWRFTPQTYSYQWTPDSTLNSAITAAPTATPLSSTLYSVTVTNPATGCYSKDSVFVAVTDTPDSGGITPYYTALCESDSLILTASAFTPGASLQWQTAASEAGPYADLPGATAVTLSTGIIDETVFFRTEVTCLSSSYSVPAAVDVSAIPPPPVAADQQRCGAGKAELFASGSGGTLSWYDSETGGNYLASGDTLITDYLEQSATYWVEEGPPPASVLSTQYDGGNFGDGVMFNVTAGKPLTITAIDLHLQNVLCDVEFYSRHGSYDSYADNASGWTLVGAAGPLEGAGIGVPSTIPLALSVAVPAGDTVAFYLTTKGGQMNSSAGLESGQVYAADDFLSIMEGVSVDYPFLGTPNPIKWNGVVHYELTGCHSIRTPVNIDLYHPQILATASDSSVCEGDTIFLQASNLGAGMFTYQWYPLLPVMFPEDGQADTVLTVPVIETVFTMIAEEYSNQCDTIIEVPVSVNPVPEVTILNLPDIIEVTAAPILLEGFPAGGIFSGTGVVDGTFDPSLAGVGGPYAITYSYTNVYGCSDDTTLFILVVIADAASAAIRCAPVQVFPNPASSFFRIQILNGQPCRILELTVTDATGRCMMHTAEGDPVLEKVIDVSQWPRGNYAVQITTTGDSFVKRLVVQ